MAAAVRLRSDFDGPALRRLARSSRDAKQMRRLLAVAAIYDGESRSEAARIGGVTLQIVRDRVVRFNAEEPVGLVDRKPPGCRPMLSADQRRALAGMVEAGPIPAVHGVVPPRQAREAPDRPGPVGLGRVRAVDQQADAEPEAARARLRQAVGTAAPPCAGCRRHPRS